MCLDQHMHKDINLYNRAQTKTWKGICTTLAKQIDSGLPKKVESKIWTLGIISTLGFGLSAFMTKHFYDVRGGLSGFKSFCNISEKVNCDKIATSSFAQILPGIPLSSLAAAGFLFILILSFLMAVPERRRLASKTAFLFASIYLITSLSYLYVMLVILGTFCLLCLVTDALVFLLFFSSLLLRNATQNPIETSNEISEKATIQQITIVFVLSLLIVPLLLKSLDHGRSINENEVQEYVDNFFKSPVVAVGSDSRFPSMGESTAPLTVVEFSDFQCPYCRMGASTLHLLQQKFPGKIRVVFRAFPLDPSCNRSVQHSMHPVACEAARLALCAIKQGKFENIYETFFENQDSYKEGSTAASEKLRSLAQGAGINVVELENCMKDPSSQDAVTKDVEEGIALNIESTPTIYVNGRKMEGVFPPPAWEAIIKKLETSVP